MIPIYYNLRSLVARRLSTSLTVVGLSLVVFVFAATLMLSHGIEAALAAGGSEQNVVLLRQGSDTEIVSSVDRDVVRVISTWPEVASRRDGTPLVAGETVVIVALPRPGGNFTNTTARGIDGTSLDIRPTVRLAAGRPPRPGHDEVLLGAALEGKTEGARLGGELSFANRSWRVVGILSAEGSAFESEIWLPGDRLRDAFQREGFSSAIVRLSPSAARDTGAFIRRVEGDPRFTVEAKTERAYWADQARLMATFIRIMGLFVSLVFGVGAVLGAMITMYAQVAARIRELGMLRAVGFRRRSVLGSVVIESGLLGTGGGLVGCVAAFFMKWVRVETVNFSTFSQMRFHFEPSPGILFASLCFGVGMGLFGGLLPALRAARLSILDALRG